MNSVSFLHRGLLFSILAIVLCAHSLSAYAATTTAAPSGFSVGAAMTVLFGNFSPKTKASEYDIPQTAAPDLKSPWFSAGDELVVRPLRVLEAKEDGKRKIILLTFAVPKARGAFDCHACAPFIGAAVFVHDGQHWKVESSRTVITQGGGFGYPPKDFRVLQVGPRRIGIEMTDRYEGQGEATKAITILVPWNGKVNEALRFITHDDDRGACGLPGGLPCYSNQKGFLVAATKNKDYFDIALNLSGTDMTNGLPYKQRIVHGTELFEWTEGFYKLKTRTGDTTSAERFIVGH